MGNWSSTPTKEISYAYTDTFNTPILERRRPVVSVSNYNNYQNTVLQEARHRSIIHVGGENTIRRQRSEAAEEARIHFESLSLTRETHQPRSTVTVPKYNSVNYVGTIGQPNKRVSTIKTGNISFISSYVWKEAQLLNWESYDYNAQPVHFVKLEPSSSEYENVQQLFLNGTTIFQINKIERVQNIYLLTAFLLKKEEMMARGRQNIEQLFHGTKSEHVMNICTGNFNWRLYGRNEGNKFGQGVSFTPISHYATYYGDKNSMNKVMFLVNVLVGGECIGTKDMKLPPIGFDTTIKENRQVIVKYEDNEFYPAYKISYYCTKPGEEKMRKNKKKQARKHRTQPTGTSANLF